MGLDASSDTLGPDRLDCAFAPRSTAKGVAAEMVALPDITSSGPSRRARRQQANRMRLIRAAALAVAESGIESVTVARITERADLGTGTFYNYFQNREEIMDAVVGDAVETLGQRLDALTLGMPDAAEIFSFSLRHLMGTAVTDPVWGWLVVRLGAAHSELLATLGPRAARDLRIGVASGRFRIPDVTIATSCTFGALISAIHSHLEGGGQGDPSVVFTEYMLRMVGLPAEEATELTRRPLPPLPSLDEARTILAAAEREAATAAG